MTNDDGRKPEGAPERSPKACAGGMGRSVFPLGVRSGRSEFRRRANSTPFGERLPIAATLYSHHAERPCTRPQRSAPLIVAAPQKESKSARAASISAKSRLWNGAIVNP